MDAKIVLSDNFDEKEREIAHEILKALHGLRTSQAIQILHYCTETCSRLAAEKMIDDFLALT